MNETIMLPVEYQDEILELPLTIVPLGYTYQLHILVNGKTLIFEKDDEGEYRVIGNAEHQGPVNRKLVSAIVATLRAIS